MQSQDVRLSVRLSHAGIVSTLLNTGLSQAFFHTKRYGNIPTTTTQQGRRAWGMKNHDFRPTSRFISEMIQDRAIVTVKCE